MVEPPTGPDGAGGTDDRSAELVAEMTLAEKLAQLGSVRARDLVTEDGFDPEAADELLAEGIGIAVHWATDGVVRERLADYRIILAVHFG